jgi:hypothetical protein
LDKEKTQEDVVEKKTCYRRERKGVDEEDKLILNSSKHETWHVYP